MAFDLPILADDDHLAILDLAHEFRADDVERAGLRGEDRRAIQLAKHQRANPERIAGADQLLVGQRDKRIGAFDLPQRIDEPLDQQHTARAGDQMQDHLGIRGRLHDRAVTDQVAPQRQPVGEIAVMRHRQPAARQLGKQRLDIAQDGLARGRIAHMADGLRTLQLLDHAPVGECIADQPHPAFGVEAGAIERGDAGSFLAAMLERVQAQRRQCRGVGMPEDAEHPALFAQAVIIETERIAQG